MLLFIKIVDPPLRHVKKSGKKGGQRIWCPNAKHESINGGDCVSKIMSVKYVVFHKNRRPPPTTFYENGEKRGGRILTPIARA